MPFTSRYFESLNQSLKSLSCFETSSDVYVKQCSDGSNAIFSIKKGGIVNDYLDHITLCIGEEQIAYIKNMQVTNDGKTVSVEHFAVEKGYTNKGVGKLVAGWIADELREKLGIKSIIFTERDDDAYKNFFQSLGAEKLPTTGSGNQKWVWYI